MGIWDLSTHHEILNVPVGRSGNVAVAFSSDGQRLAATGKDNTITISDANNGKQLLTLEGHTAPVVQLQFNPNGTQLVSASENGEDGVIIWDSMTGKQVRVLKEAGPVLGLAFSPDGKYLATGGQDRMAAVWDARTGQQIFSMIGHNRAVFAASFMPDGSRLATASGDGTVKIWDAKNGKELLTLFGHTGRVFSLAISPDGTRLATAGQDGISRVYLLNLEDLVKLARTRVTRSLTAEECQKYLHLSQCPTSP